MKAEERSLPCGCQVPHFLCPTAYRLLMAEEDAAQDMRNAYGKEFVPAKIAWIAARDAYNAHIQPALDAAGEK